MIRYFGSLSPKFVSINTMKLLPFFVIIFLSSCTKNYQSEKIGKWDKKLREALCELHACKEKVALYQMHFYKEVLFKIERDIAYNEKLYEKDEKIQNQPLFLEEREGLQSIILNTGDPEIKQESQVLLERILRFITKVKGS